MPAQAYVKLAAALAGRLAAAIGRISIPFEDFDANDSQNEAIELCKKAIAIRETKLGTEHIAVASVCDLPIRMSLNEIMSSAQQVTFSSASRSRRLFPLRTSLGTQYERGGFRKD